MCADSFSFSSHANTVMNPDSQETPITTDLMTPEDLDEVMGIENLSFPRAWTREMFRQELSNPVALALVFRAAGELVGYACMWEVMDEAHIQTIAVHPQRRGLGVGTRMMEEVERVCEEHGSKRIILEVARRNLIARNLYKKSGFHGIGFRRQYYSATRDDAIVMEKRLGLET